MKKLFFLFILNSVFIFSCSNTDDSISNLIDCSANIGCTEVFVSLTFSPKNENGQPIMLDSFYSQNLDNGKTYSISSGNLLNTTSYVVVTDGQLDEINQSGTNVRFFGLQGNQIVIQQDFVVGHNCCHVVPLSGPFDGV